MMSKSFFKIRRFLQSLLGVRTIWTAILLWSYTSDKKLKKLRYLWRNTKLRCSLWKMKKLKWLVDFTSLKRQETRSATASDLDLRQPDTATATAEKLRVPQVPQQCHRIHRVHRTSFTFTAFTTSLQPLNHFAFSPFRLSPYLALC